MEGPFFVGTILTIYPLLLLALILPDWQEVCANGLALVRSIA